MPDTPLPTTPAGMGGIPTNELGDPIGLPQQSQGPVNELGASLPQQTQQQPQPQAPDPAAAQAQHDAMFGKIAKQILGMQNNYSTDANGTLVNNLTPQKPGQLFRSLLGAALIGGAAGASHPEQGFVGGFARGGAAGVQQAQQNDQAQKQQAQTDFENNQKVQQETRQNTLMQATLQQMHSEQIARQATSDLASQAAHDKHNAASAALVTNLTNAGGVPAIIPVGDTPASEFTAPDLAAAYVKDPSILHGPQNFVRHFVDTTDSSDLSFNGTHWVTSDGTPVDMTSRTSVKAIDVPINAMTTKIPTTGKDINAAYGGKLVNTDTTYQMSPLDMDALNSKRMSTAKSKLADELEQKRVALTGMQIALDGKRINAAITSDNRAQFAGADKEISERIKTLEDQIKDPMIDPAVKQTAQAHIDQANKELETIRKKLYPGTNVDGDLDSAQQALATQTPTVLMLNPQGQQVAVPQDKVDGALKNGYKHTGAAATPTDPSIGLNQRNAKRRESISDVLHAIPNVL